MEGAWLGLGAATLEQLAQWLAELEQCLAQLVKQQPVPGDQRSLPCPR